MELQMYSIHKLLILIVLSLGSVMASGQRSYAPNSILATGNWYKISILESGIYKVDVPFLNSLGITGSIPSDQLRIFTRLDGMLPESNAVSRIDDLKEIAIDVEDG